MTMGSSLLHDPDDKDVCATFHGFLNMAKHVFSPTTFHPQNITGPMAPSHTLGAWALIKAVAGCEKC